MGDSVQINQAADHGRVAAEPRPPVAIAEHGHARAPGADPGKSSGRSRTWSTTANIAVAAPVPSETLRAATKAYGGRLLS